MLRQSSPEQIRVLNLVLQQLLSVVTELQWSIEEEEALLSLHKNTTKCCLAASLR